MKRITLALVLLVICVGVSRAQKAQADADYYPVGYPGETWAGEVIAIDNDARTLTLSFGSGKNAQTFVASIPDAPYEWAHDLRKSRVLNFAYDKQAKTQRYIWVGPGFAASLVPDSGVNEVRRANPPPENVITDFADFMGRSIVVYYTVRSHTVNGQNVKYNDVWRIRVVPKKK